MCGIAGIYSERSSDLNRLPKMIKSLSHRGPDGEGTFVDNKVSMGNRRLAIIDIEGGQQPIKNEDGSITVVYNGEIYNFRELRRELVSRRHRFLTKSDTEIFVHGWEEWGERMFNKLNGIFAVAIWDKNKEELTLARDSLGVKPLYYYQDSQRLVFGSEIKAILKAGIKKTINKQACLEFLALRQPLGENSFYEGIKILPAGTLMRVTGNCAEIRRWWGWHKRPSESQGSLSKLDEFLNAAVDRQLMSEVPLGVFLSGGLDSSLLVALASKKVKKLKTVTVGYQEEEFNETSYAKRIADLYKTDHLEIKLESKLHWELITELIKHKDEPLSVPNEVAIFEMSKEVKKYFTVVLSGEGADEMFAGYPKYQQSYNQFKYLERLEKFPKLMRKGLGKSIEMSNRPLSSELSWALDQNDFDLAYLIRFGLGINKKDLMVFRPETLNQLAQDLYARLEEELTWKSDYLLMFSEFEIKHSLHNLLARVDRMTMSQGIEARVPYLDKQVVEYVLSHPRYFWVDNKIPKEKLRRVSSKYLPKDIIDRPKMGFPTPWETWFKRTEHKKEISSKIKKSGVLSEYWTKTEIGKMLNSSNDNQFLWRLYNFQLWYEINFE